MRYMSCPSHSSRFCQPNNIQCGYRLLSPSEYSFLYSLVTSSLFCPNIFLNTLFPDILSLCSSLSVSNQFSHTYNTTEKLYYKICIPDIIMQLCNSSSSQGIETLQFFLQYQTLIQFKKER